MRWSGWPPLDEEGERTRQHNNQKITEEGGEDGGDGSDDDDDDEDNNDNDDEATEQPWLWWSTRRCFGMIICHPR